MIRLRAMQAKEFEGFAAYFVPDYASEIARNYRLNEADARMRAEQELRADLPDGAATPGQTIMCVVLGTPADEVLVGYLWFRVDPESRNAFIFDFHILPAHQRQGHAKAALTALEAMLAEQGITEIRLRVASDNDIAKTVYERSGFAVTGLNMSKPIGE